MNRNNGREIGARLVILRDYLFANADKTHAVSMEDIQQLYEEAGYGGEKSGDYISIKTVYRDLDALYGIWGIETKYVEKYKGYVVLNPPFSPNDLRLIVDSIQSSKFITQRKADALTRIITDKYDRSRRNKLNRPAYVFNRIHSQNEEVVDDAAKLYDAIAADSKIGFLYFHMRPGRKRDYSNGGKRIVVSPFALYWSEGNLYLCAYDGKKIRYYRVDRMERISAPLQEEREGKDIFDTKDLTAPKVKMFQMFDGKEYSVKMRFHNRLTDAVMDQFGRDIMMIPDGNEHFTFTAAVKVSPPFYAWVSTFGRSAKIISPPEAVKGMKDFLQKSMDMYKDDGNT